MGSAISDQGFGYFGSCIRLFRIITNQREVGTPGKTFMRAVGGTENRLRMRLIKAISPLKKERISKDHFVPKQPQHYAQTAKHRKDKQIRLNLPYFLVSHPADQGDGAKQSDEQGPAVVPRKRCQKSARGGKNQVLEFPILRPADEVVARHSGGSHTNRLA